MKMINCLIIVYLGECGAVYANTYKYTVQWVQCISDQLPTLLLSIIQKENHIVKKV